MESKRYSTMLDYDELILLDGKCSDEVQDVVNLAKIEMSFGLDRFCNEILAESLKTGELTWTRVSISNCCVCDNKPRGYYRYDRNSRYHRKGELNYDRPFSYQGIKPNHHNIVFNGVQGICEECWKKSILPKLINYIITNDLPIQIQKNDIAETRYKKDRVNICFKCGAEMYQSEMGMHMTLLGDGDYPSKCPYCGAESLPFGRSHKYTDKFRMIKIEEKKPEQKDESQEDTLPHMPDLTAEHSKAPVKRRGEPSDKPPF